MNAQPPGWDIEILGNAGRRFGADSASPHHRRNEAASVIVSATGSVFLVAVQLEAGGIESEDDLLQRLGKFLDEQVNRQLVHLVEIGDDRPVAASSSRSGALIPATGRPAILAAGPDASAHGTGHHIAAQMAWSFEFSYPSNSLRICGPTPPRRHEFG